MKPKKKTKKRREDEIYARLFVRSGPFIELRVVYQNSVKFVAAVHRFVVAFCDANVSDLRGRYFMHVSRMWRNVWPRRGSVATSSTFVHLCGKTRNSCLDKSFSAEFYR